MEYLEIVLQGYFNEDNRAYLERYFFREFKKAEKEQFFAADEFFNGCLRVLENWERYFEDEVFKRKNQLHWMLIAAENGTLPHTKEMEGKTTEQIIQETKKYCEEELKNVRPDGVGGITFLLHLHPLTNGRIYHNLKYKEVLQIKVSILKAFQKVQTQNEDLQPQQTETKAERETVELKPTFTTEAVPIVFNNIKDYFSVEEQEELKHILETGNKASKKLLFKGRLNGLADTFKRLYENNFIQGCEKRHLEDWIVSNFLFLHRGKAKDIKPKVINKYVSAGGHTICENPLIKIDEGRIQKATDN